MIWVPRVARRRPGQIEGGSAKGEFMGGELAQHHRAGLGQHAHGGGVLGRHPAFQQLGMRGRGDAARGVDVLMGDGDAVEPAARGAGHQARLGSLGVVHPGFKGPLIADLLSI